MLARAPSSTDVPVADAIPKYSARRAFRSKRTAPSAATQRDPPLLLRRVGESRRWPAKQPALRRATRHLANAPLPGFADIHLRALLSPSTPSTFEIQS